MSLDPQQPIDSVPWERAKLAAWVSEVNQWVWTPHGDGEWTKSGNCPRCHHSIMIRLEDGTLVGVAPSASSPGSATVSLDRHLATCNCSSAHEGRPDFQKYGCGSGGLIEPPRL